jgi:hypothetical protein
MNNWQAWIVPVIALGVWILSHLLRGNEQDKKAPPRGRQPGENPPGRAKEPLTDLDRFLREVNRRRQNAEERRTGPAAKPPIVLTAQPIVERPRPSVPKPARPAPPQRRQAARPVPAPSKSATPKFQPEPLTVLPADGKTEHAIPLPASEQTPLAFPTSSEIIRIATPAALATAAKMAPAIRQASTTSTPPPFLTLLSSAENLRTAIVLREIFDPPLSKRRRG